MKLLPFKTTLILIISIKVKGKKVTINKENVPLGLWYNSKSLTVTNKVSGSTS
jgi:hypothetical protein